jgi:serine/threonine-protein kinase
MLYEWDWLRAESLFKQVTAARPNFATAYHWYSDFLVGRGRLDEALAQIRQAQRLDPLSRIIGKVQGDILLYLRRLDDAEAAYRDVIRLDPSFGAAHGGLGSLYSTRGRYRDAVPELELATATGDQYLGNLIYALARSGAVDSARKLLAQTQTRAEREYVGPGRFAVAYTGLGDFDQAFAALDRAVRDHDPSIIEDSQTPEYDPLRADPRWARFKAALGQR